MLLECESTETLALTETELEGRVDKSQSELDAQAKVWDSQSVWMGPDSVACARLAAGSCLSVTSAVLEGHVACGAAVVRPPGHHCLSSRAMGFCLLNNVAIAAQHALKASPNNVEKVMVRFPSPTLQTIHYSENLFRLSTGMSIMEMELSRYFTMIPTFSMSPFIGSTTGGFVVQCFSSSSHFLLISNSFEDSTLELLAPRLVQWAEGVVLGRRSTSLGIVRMVD